MAASQLDMFGRTNDPVVKKKSSRQARQASELGPVEGQALETSDLDAEDMARRLEASGRYRILRKLSHPDVVSSPRPGFPRRGVIIDTETTGLNYRTDKLIEIGAVAFTFDEDANLGDITGVYSGLQDPGIPIPALITKLTGINDAMVAGQSLDLLALAKVVEPADLVIAHNAAFDRPFCEKLSAMFSSKAWACSVKEIDWQGRGFEGNKLGYLIGQSGHFHDGHRAVDDCYALFEVLRNFDSVQGKTAFAELYAASQRAQVRLWAEHSPFDMKDKLKARGYRWSDGSEGRPKSWWTEVTDDALEDEINYLRTEIYHRADVEPLTVHLTATERFKS